MGRYFDEALKWDPDDVKLRYNRGLAYLNQGLYAEALEEATAAWAVDPELELVHQLYSRAAEHIESAARVRVQLIGRARNNM